MANLQIVPASKKVVEPQYVEMMVPLYSYGCGKKVKKALSQLKGIYSVNVDYKKQKVTVWGICNKQDVLDTIRSKRRGARFWSSHDDQKIRDDDDDDDQNSEADANGGDHIDDRSTKSVISQRLFRSLSWKAWKKGHQVLLRKISLSPSFKLAN